VSRKHEVAFGVDIFWTARAQTWGCQRKEVADFLASIHDGRLKTDRAKMRRLDHPILLIEGKIRWTLDGQLMTNGFGQSWSRTQHRNYLLSVQNDGIMVEFTDDLNDTILRVQEMHKWSDKDHESGKGRPKPVSSWGKAGHRDFQIHLLTSFDGIGVKAAEAILDHFGKVPMHWDVDDAKELAKVPGIGPVRAKRMMAALDGMSVETKSVAS
jgi:ERCC4-type nuclease